MVKSSGTSRLLSNQKELVSGELIGESLFNAFLRRSSADATLQASCCLWLLKTMTK